MAGANTGNMSLDQIVKEPYLEILFFIGTFLQVWESYCQ